MKTRHRKYSANTLAILKSVPNTAGIFDTSEITATMKKRFPEAHAHFRAAGGIHATFHTFVKRGWFELVEHGRQKIPNTYRRTKTYPGWVALAKAGRTQDREKDTTEPAYQPGSLSPQETAWREFRDTIEIPATPHEERHVAHLRGGKPGRKPSTY